MFGTNLTLVIVILFFFALYGVIHIISQIAKQQRCPSERKLKDVVLRRLNPDSIESKAVISHLGVCQKCRDRIDEFNHPNPAKNLIEQKS